MRTITSYQRFVVLAVLVACLLSFTAFAQSGGPAVASLTLNPAVIDGGSGGTSAVTVTLAAPAPEGGTLVQLASSNSALAASSPRVTIPAGAISATVPVATNARYRRYSGLSFSATIVASANGSSASATLTVTAQHLPADILSDSGVREGTMCGGIFPARRGDAGVLYRCSATGNPSSGPCTFAQECKLGCQRNQPDGFKFNDACATSGPNPVALNSTTVLSGDRPSGTIRLSAPAPAGASAVANVGSMDASVFPYGYQAIAPGATSLGFDVATSYVPSIEFASVMGNIFYSSSNQRIGQTWLTLVPPDPAPAQALPTLAELDLVGPYPVPGGQIAYATVIVSGISPGQTITLTSSDPAIASVSATAAIPAGSNWAQVPITIQAPATASTVTISATDGRYTFPANLTVLP